LLFPAFALPGFLFCFFTHLFLLVFTFFSHIHEHSSKLWSFIVEHVFSFFLDVFGSIFNFAFCFLALSFIFGLFIIQRITGCLFCLADEFIFLSVFFSHFPSPLFPKPPSAPICCLNHAGCRGTRFCRSLHYSSIPCRVCCSHRCGPVPYLHTGTLSADLPAAWRNVRLSCLLLSYRPAPYIDKLPGSSCMKHGAAG